MQKQTGIRKLHNFALRLGLRVEFGSKDTNFHSKTEYGRPVQIIEIKYRFRDFVADYNHKRPFVAQDIAHELGHYLVAPKGRRHRKDYGIPNGGRRRSPKAEKFWAADEAKARLVEHYILYKFGFRTLRTPWTLTTNTDALDWWDAKGEKMIRGVLWKNRGQPRRRQRAAHVKKIARAKAALMSAKKSRRKPRLLR